MFIIILLLHNVGHIQIHIWHLLMVWSQSFRFSWFLGLILHLQWHLLGCVCVLVCVIADTEWACYATEGSHMELHRVSQALFEHAVWDIYIYIYIYAFSRRFYPKRLTSHSSYSFTFDQLLLSLGIEPMILALLAPCSTIWATGKLRNIQLQSSQMNAAIAL